MSKNLRTLCQVAMMAALYFVLKKFLGIEAGTLKINFATLPVTVLALLAGPIPAAAAAAIGEFLYQILGYGFSATTLLWLVPPALRVVIIGLAARMLGRLKPLEERPALCDGACVAAAVIATVANTAIIALDSIIYGYYTYAYVFGNLLVRMGTGVMTAVMVATVAMPVTGALRRQGFAGKTGGYYDR